MGKGSSKGHTPREAKDNLKSTQLLSVIDAISEGPVEGPVDGLKSVLLNSTPVLDTEGNTNISGSVNANSGTLNNVTINENCQIKGKLSANQIEGDIVKTVSKSFPRTNSYASGTITVRISDDQKFDRQVMIPPVLFRGGKHENFNSNNQQSYWYSTCRLRVTRNGQEIFNQTTTDAQGVFSSVIDMPAGQGTLTLTFTVSSSGANNWTPTTSISDLLVVVMKKSTAGISIS
ncbi:phage tail tip protein [Escherichia coli]|uniref:phage tail tip domain-containing protein n=1 Tax=Escherichia coli TaxID=562 RepID=UPI000BB76A1F|nr:host specificity protein J [Escherichia coli]MCV8139279.1 host specificity protein J [Escherichia coli]MDF9057475.1 host specificity protein J [Escherichia coli]MEC3717178.1 host specificity protein J [Escherichia coli]